MLSAGYIPSGLEAVADNEQLLPLARSGDPEALTRLYELNRGLIRMVTARFRYSGYDEEELFQIGSIGLLKAVERFDPSFAVKFSTYAVPTIIGEIKGFLRDDGAVKIQRSVKENYGKIRRGQETLRQRLGREATVSEIAALLELDPEDIIFALDACQAPFCLNAAFTGNDLETPTLLDRLSATDDVCPLEERLALNAALTRLPPREEDILRRRFFQEETQTVIAEALGISQVQISRLEKSALLKLRRYLAAE